MVKNRKVYRLRIFELRALFLENFGVWDMLKYWRSLKMAAARQSCLERYENLKKLVLEKFPDFSARDLCVVLGRLGTFHYDKKKGFLLGKEKLLYNFLIENGFNPFTIYRWALLERVPNEIKFQLRNHYLSQKKASRLFFEKRHETETSLQVDIKESGLKLIKEM